MHTFVVHALATISCLAPLADDDVEVDVVSTTQPVDIRSWRQRKASSSSYLTISPTPYISGLAHTDQEDIVNPLTQLAIIATGPQSPLLHNNQALTDYQRYRQQVTLLAGHVLHASEVVLMLH